MQSFSEFMINNNLCDQETFLDAFVLYCNSQKSLAALVRENKFLTDSEQVKVIFQMERESQSYKEACMSLGLWSKFENKLNDLPIIANIYELLVSKFGLDVKVLSNALLWYEILQDLEKRMSHCWWRDQELTASSGH